MTHTEFLKGLGRVALVCAVLAPALWLGFGRSSFDFYGAATIALVTLPWVTRLLWKRLPHAGLSRAWTFLYTGPVLLASIVQIGYWAAFFRYGPSNPALGVVRAMLQPALDVAVPVLGLAFCLGWLILVIRLSTPPAG